MRNVTITLTEDQAMYVGMLLGVESSKANRDSQMVKLLFGEVTTDDAKKAWATAIKPSTDREAALYAIEKAFDAALTAGQEGPTDTPHANTREAGHE